MRNLSKRLKALTTLALTILLLTYADGLNTNGSMNVYNNRIEVEI